jgi:GR25 family glycosyltransferase involved in LPS biosynthesis
MNIKLIILFIILMICIILCILIKKQYNERFSNKLSDNSKYYFIHIPKNAGQSINKLLSENSDIPIKQGHHSYKITHNNEILVLRDPIDRFISAFYYLYKMKDEYNIPFDKIKTPDKFIEALNYKHNVNHKEAMRIYQEEYQNQPIQGKIHGSNWVFAPQSLYYVNPSFVLRFTNLESDFNKCLSDIGYQKKVSLPKKNISIHKDKYLSEKSIAFLKDYYKKDFELLESNPFTYSNTSEGFQNKNTNKLIDGILYINLAHRVDRKKHIEKELNKLSPICNKIERIDAVKHKNGAKGCGMSHIKALEYAKQNKWNNILIVEDDILFKDKNLVENVNNSLNDLNDKYDILMFSGNVLKQNNTNINNLAKPINVQTTSCYLINSHYYDTLIKVFEESVENLKDINEHSNSHKWAIDRNWFKLQEKDNWYIFKPTIAYQMEDYSDIENRKVNYKV